MRFGPILEREVFDIVELEKMGMPLVSNEIYMGKGLLHSSVSIEEWSDPEDLHAGELGLISPINDGEPSAKRLRTDEGPSSAVCEVCV